MRNSDSFSSLVGNFRVVRQKIVRNENKNIVNVKIGYMRSLPVIDVRKYFENYQSFP